MKDEMTDYELEDAYEEIFKTITKQLSEGVDPLVVSGSLMAIAVRLYRTILNDDDFARVLNAIPETVNVRPYDNPTTLH